MSYTIGYRMPMRDRPRVRVRLVVDLREGTTEATRRAQERLAGLPDGTVVEGLMVMTGDGGRGGDEKAAPKPSETPIVYVVWNRVPCIAVSTGPGIAPVPLSPSGLAYPSEDGGMSFGLPTNDALCVLVTADGEKKKGDDSDSDSDSDSEWMQDEGIASLPDGSVVERLWQEDGETVDRTMFVMYGRSLAVLVDPGDSGGSGGSGGAS